MRERNANTQCKHHRLYRKISTLSKKNTEGILDKKQPNGLKQATLPPFAGANLDEEHDFTIQHNFNFWSIRY